MLVRDAGARKLMTWYAKNLQYAIDLIWGNIEWRYNFKNYGKVLCSKVKIQIITGSLGLRIC